MGLRNDYRVSTIVVLCKDCGQDVGLYPARHECTNVKRPYLPTLCSTTSEKHWSSTEDVPDLVIDSTPASTTVTRQASDSSMESGKCNFFRSNSVAVKKTNNISDDEMESSPSYFDNYATYLKTSSSFNDINDASPSGKKLWGRTKENEKWKELVAENKKKDETKTSGKLWERIIHATMSNTLEEQYHDSGPESDDEDWEGETHVSRILREYYISVNKSLPTWLYDDRTTKFVSVPVTEQKSEGVYRSKTTRGRRLWQASEEENTSARERERQALRATTITRTQSERIAPSLLSSGRAQGSNLRNNYYNNKQQDEQDNLYGSIAPRRTNTTRAPPVKHYLNNNIPSSVTTARSTKSYF